VAPAPSNLLTLYHSTSAEAAGGIIARGFRSTATSGMFGVGIYFARSPEETVGKAQYGANDPVILECSVNMGRMKTVRLADRSITLQKLRAEGYDSVYAEASNLPNGVSRPECIVFESDRIVSCRALFSGKHSTPSQQAKDQTVLNALLGFHNAGSSGTYNRNTYGDVHRCNRCGSGNIYTPLTASDSHAQCGSCGAQVPRPKVLDQLPWTAK
jgi:hypothetical protein